MSDQQHLRRNSRVVDDEEQIARSMAALASAMIGAEPHCDSTEERDGVLLRCAGITCALFPGKHKAYGVEDGWVDRDDGYQPLGADDE